MTSTCAARSSPGTSRSSSAGRPRTWRRRCSRSSRAPARMYIPQANRVEDPAKARAFIHAHGFATLVSRGESGSPWASHLPVLLEESPEGDRILGHMARANEQWSHLASGAEVLCIFQGPHSYISPSWYAATLA